MFKTASEPRWKVTAMPPRAGQMATLHSSASLSFWATGDVKPMATENFFGEVTGQVMSSFV